MPAAVFRTRYIDDLLQTGLLFFGVTPLLIYVMMAVTGVGWAAIVSLPFAIMSQSILDFGLMQWICTGCFLRDTSVATDEVKSVRSVPSVCHRRCIDARAGDSRRGEGGGIGLLRGCLRQQGISVRVKAELIQSWPKACDQVQFAFVQDHI